MLIGDIFYRVLVTALRPSLAAAAGAGTGTGAGAVVAVRAQ